jgi:hypothetical protein
MWTSRDMIPRMCLQFISIRRYRSCETAATRWPYQLLATTWKQCFLVSLWSWFFTATCASILGQYIRGEITFPHVSTRPLPSNHIQRSFYRSRHSILKRWLNHLEYSFAANIFLPESTFSVLLPKNDTIHSLELTETNSISCFINFHTDTYTYKSPRAGPTNTVPLIA